MPLVIAPALIVSADQRGELEAMARSSVLPHRQVIQARGLLLAADGVANEEIARRCATTSDTVRRWRRRFAEAGVDGVGRIASGRGRRSWLPDRIVEAVVADTLQAKPEDGSTHWTTRLMAARHGIVKDRWRGSGGITS
jgi:transposase